MVQFSCVCWMQTCKLMCLTAVMLQALTDIAQHVTQGSGKDLIQPVLDNQLKAASPLLVPAKVCPCKYLLLKLLLNHDKTASTLHHRVVRALTEMPR